MTRLENKLSVKSRIDERLWRTANVLLLIASFIDNLGLLNGKMGITIFFYNYSRYTGNKIYGDYAGELIDEIYEEINNNTPIDFANGLTGIGWGFEYLVENRFVDADTDETLEDIDNSVYQKLLLGFDYQELHGYLLFQLARFKHKREENHQKGFLEKHKILLLLNKCEKLLTSHRSEEQAIFPDLMTLKAIHYFLSEIGEIDLFHDKTKMLAGLVLPMLEIAASDNKKARDPLIDHATSIVWQQLVYHEDDNPDDDMKSLFSEVFYFVDNEENWNSYLIQSSKDKWGLRKGLAGIGMTLLRLISQVNSQNVEASKTKINSVRQSENVPLVFIFKSNARGMQYGIGTYIRELSEALLLHTNVILYIVAYYNSDCQEYSIDSKSPRYFILNIPSPASSFPQNNLFESRYASAAVNLLSDIFPPNGNIIFQMNYIDDLPILKKLKERYTHPVISVVHFAQWQQLFNGNREKLKGLNIDIPKNNIEFTLSREKEMYKLSDRIVSVTRYMKEFLIEEYGISPDKIGVVPNGIDSKSI